MPEYRRNSMLGCKPVNTVYLKAPASLINARPLAHKQNCIFFFLQYTAWALNLTQARGSEKK